MIVFFYQRFYPVDWQRLDWFSKASRAFQKEAISYGVANQGFSVSIRGPNGQFALFTVSYSGNDVDWAAFTEEHMRSMLLIAHAFNHKALDLEPDRTPEHAQALSPREVAAALMLAGGEIMEGFGVEHFVGVFDARMVRIYRRIGSFPEVLGQKGEGRVQISVGLWHFASVAKAQVAQKTGLSPEVSRLWVDRAFGSKECAELAKVG